MTEFQLRSTQDWSQPSDKALAKIPIFRGLPPNTKRALSQSCQTRCYSPGELIIEYRDKRNQVFFLIKGCVRVNYYAPDGKEVLFLDQHAGDLFGELSALDGRPRSANVLALTESLVLIMPAAQFCQIVQNNSIMSNALLLHLTQRIRTLSARVIEFSTLPVQDRVRAELLRLAGSGTPGNCGIIVRPAPTHAEIASRISTHREAVTRELNELVRAGLVETRHRTLIIRDRQTLAAIIQNHTVE
ncbi:MAG: Crp/Fnr family transcriptional regulator [Acetobacteraceae bacterium]|nr:Crp/Fnr family transcriptional regulator [Acetobacteraceae bacterium]